MTRPDRGGQEAVEAVVSPDMTGLFVFCNPVELNTILKVLSDLIELRLWFLSKTIDCKGVLRLLSCL